MSSKPKLDLKQVVVCDDIRREDNGKEILIGVYGSSIIVSKFPASLALSFWLQFEPNETGSTSLEFRLVGPEDLEFAQAETKIEVMQKETVSLGLKGIPVNLQIPVELALELKHPGGHWETAKRIKVVRGAVPVPGRKQ